MKLKVILLTGGILLSGWLAASYASADAGAGYVTQEAAR